MKIPTSLLLGASLARAYTPSDQTPLQAVVSPHTIKQHLDNSREAIDKIFPTSYTVEDAIQMIQDATPKINQFGADAKSVWNSITDSLKAFPAAKPPKNRKPDNSWDYVIKGDDIQNSWTVNAAGQKEREIDGRLEQYNMRVKKVDPSALGVDTVKQYSGYLDDEENDKHLFYCKSFTYLLSVLWLTL